MTAPSARRWPTGLEGIGFGADYNPEQWDEETRQIDIELMREAGVTIVTLGIFSWANVETAEGAFEFGWLDRSMDQLHGAGIRVSLATGTASPPPWLTHRHPEILPVDHDGRTLWPGARQAYSVSHPIWRRYALRYTGLMAARYANHPALAQWHVDNELGCHVPRDYSDASANEFRRWLRQRYQDIDALNAAWGTAFWSQRYGTFDEILPPRLAPTGANPSQQLDFARFSSDAYLDYYRQAVGVLAEHSPGVPVTTNLMAAPRFKGIDYFRWAESLQTVAQDHYVIAGEAEPQVELAFSSDLARGIAGGQPWIVMETAVSAVNWQQRNSAKKQGELLRNTVSYLGRGADLMMFFQWRQSVAGSEKFHSALMPHAGEDSDIWRETKRLGKLFGGLGPIRGSLVRSRVALVFDYEAWWATDLDSHPSVDVRYMDQVLASYRALWAAGITVDIVPPSRSLAVYDLIVVPTLYLAGPVIAAELEAAVQRGASAVVTYFSGIVDKHDRVLTGGYPGWFRHVLGIWTEEFAPLLDGERVLLDDGGSASVWTEKVRLVDAKADVAFASGPLQGSPAITRRDLASGGAVWYVGTRLDNPGWDRLMARVLDTAGIAPDVESSPGVEVILRHSDADTYAFVANHTAESCELDLAGFDYVRSRPVSSLCLDAGQSAIVRLAAGDS